MFISPSHSVSSFHTSVCSVFISVSPSLPLPPSLPSPCCRRCLASCRPCDGSSLPAGLCVTLARFLQLRGGAAARPPPPFFVGTRHCTRPGGGDPGVVRKGGGEYNSAPNWDISTHSSDFSSDFSTEFDLIKMLLYLKEPPEFCNALHCC